MLEDPALQEVDDVEVVDEADEGKVPIAKVEPYGAEELREVMVHRKQTELNRQKDERLRRQAYKDALDVKIFEEELEASKRRKGGANPAVYVEENFQGSGDLAVTITDFKFSTNEFPLRLAPTGKCSFIPLFLGTAGGIRPVRPKKCPLKHDLAACFYSWMNCALCQKRKTHYYCTRWCSYYICSSCYESERRVQDVERRDPTKNPTYLRCSNLCSFTLQIPTAGGIHGSVNGEFTISMEIRVEKLPAKGHLQSLLRLSLPDLSQSRRLHRTSLYLNGDGVIVSRPMGNGGAVEDGRTMRAGVWHIISIAVKPEEGEMLSYVNGRLCHSASGLDPADLRLHHKLVILGGGRQAHSRGGDIRRVVIHSAYLDASGIESVFKKLANENPVIGGRARVIQSNYRGYLIRKKLTEQGIPVKKAPPIPAFVPPPPSY
jgi:hypothetical protein